MSTDDWCTPKWLTAILGAFDLDPCWNRKSHLKPGMACHPNDPDALFRDGLKFPWHGKLVFCNPPYSNVGPWAAKLAAHDHGWVALLKLDPTTKWWATLMTAQPVIAPFRKRIKFEGEQSMTANFPSVLIYSAWRPSTELRQHLWLSEYARAA